MSWGWQNLQNHVGKAKTQTKCNFVLHASVQIWLTPCHGWKRSIFKTLWFKRRIVQYKLVILAVHNITNKMTCAPSEDSDQPGHPPSLISLPCLHEADSEDSDQTGRMPRLIWVFPGPTCHFVGFVMRRLIYMYDLSLSRWLEIRLRYTSEPLFNTIVRIL